MKAEPEQVKRTQEIEEATNLYFIHPISRVLVTYFARWGVRPNTVSVLGMVFGGLAALAYYHYAQWPMVVLGFVLMIAWHIMDGSDGQLARLTGQTSELGKALDGLCDHLSFVLIYVSLSLASAQVLGSWVWILSVAAGISHVAQATAYEFQRQAYDYWVFDKASARIVRPKEFEERLPEGRSLARRMLDFMMLSYLRVQFRMAGVNAMLMADLEQALQETDDQSMIRQAYRQFNLHAVKSWSLLCSNYRTLAIFVACLAGNPVYFFLFEFVLLNATLVWLRYMQGRQNRALQEWLALSMVNS
ncbi:MAG TPA: CDP-alcohol phosphatidyltransferase family protein [Rhodothermales bacterium]|nr:CDP-alcohol phosphatidyltransferase family protein [Rhodothermales bacterium]